MLDFGAKSLPVIESQIDHLLTVLILVSDYLFCASGLLGMIIVPTILGYDNKLVTICNMLKTVDHSKHFQQEKMSPRK